MSERAQFASEQTRINTGLLTMGVKVEESLRMALLALRNQDVELARRVKAADLEIDSLQAQLEDEAAVVIATQQPVASDLRFLVALFKATNELERAGDHAVHLAKVARKLSGDPPLRLIAKLERMAEIGCVMVRGAVDAFLARDADLALLVAAMDDEVDALHKALVDEVLLFMKVNPDDLAKAARVLTTSGYLERLGDHMTNLCEAVVFAVRGNRVYLNE